MFGKGLDLALEAFDRTFIDGSDQFDHMASCSRMILFLTDGKDESDFKMSNYRARLSNTIILSFSFGNLADMGDQQVTKKMACQTNGIWYAVEDGADIASKMYSYFAFLALGLEETEPRWITYKDSFTGTDLVAACHGANYREGGNKVLIGVVCVDLNLILDLDLFRQKPDYDEAWTTIEQKQERCGTWVKPSPETLDLLREEAVPQYTTYQCLDCDMTDDDCPVVIGDMGNGGNQGNGSTGDEPDSAVFGGVMSVMLTLLVASLG